MDFIRKKIPAEVSESAGAKLLRCGTVTQRNITNDLGKDESYLVMGELRPAGVAAGGIQLLLANLFQDIE